MSISIQAMEDIATSLPEVSFNAGGSDGNVIEVTDLGDDMGMSLLTNNRYSNGSSSSQQPSINLNGGGS